MEWPKKPIGAIFCIPAGIANDFSCKLMKLLQMIFSLISFFLRKRSGTAEDICTAGTKPGVVEGAICIPTAMAHQTFNVWPSWVRVDPLRPLFSQLSVDTLYGIGQNSYFSKSSYVLHN